MTDTPDIQALIRKLKREGESRGRTSYAGKLFLDAAKALETAQRETGEISEDLSQMSALWDDEKDRAKTAEAKLAEGDRLLQEWLNLPISMPENVARQQPPWQLIAGDLVTRTYKTLASQPSGNASHTDLCGSCERPFSEHKCRDCGRMGCPFSQEPRVPKPWGPDTRWRDWLNSQQTTGVPPDRDRLYPQEVWTHLNRLPAPVWFVYSSRRGCLISKSDIEEIIASLSEVERFGAALERIANTKGIYGAQAYEFQQIASAAVKKKAEEPRDVRIAVRPSAFGDHYHFTNTPPGSDLIIAFENSGSGRKPFALLLPHQLYVKNLVDRSGDIEVVFVNSADFVGVPRTTLSKARGHDNGRRASE